VIFIDFIESAYFSIGFSDEIDWKNQLGKAIRRNSKREETAFMRGSAKIFFET
jgi:hypothetical protein